MDTDDLSLETYKSIIETSDRFHHDLTLQFGLLAEDCNTDDDFLDKSEFLIKDWIENWDLEEVIMDIFFENLPIKSEFKRILDRLLNDIHKVRQIPIGHRKFDLY